MTGISVYPACTRLDRCGGCCSHPLLSCQPSTVETIVRDVLVIDTINLSDKMVSVNLTRHLSCGCECRVQEHHCNHLQTYVPDECRCECTNTNQRDLCLQDETKLWDESSCTCGCRYADTECSTGMRFDLESCRWISSNWNLYELIVALDACTLIFMIQTLQDLLYMADLIRRENIEKINLCKCF